ncbi:hypothetical protein EK21DRAFT_107101 [Setomelanomma holmii]|uniref:BTB domain-containing protein n=1 Tax=Setomelanomma holmii TaxID=210430 RepID=A0A9P4LSJ2_9PLEO|nr:hypothetical protein EK21DRAFT_107101 [Setomelanomma holmii]
MANSKAKPSNSGRPALRFPNVSLKDPTVLIEVGGRHEKYHVHKGLLTHHSDYFREALQGPFNVFVHWLYVRTISKLIDDNDTLKE